MNEIFSLLFIESLWSTGPWSVLEKLVLEIWICDGIIATLVRKSANSIDGAGRHACKICDMAHRDPFFKKTKYTCSLRDADAFVAHDGDDIGGKI